VKKKAIIPPHSGYAKCSLKQKGGNRKKSIAYLFLLIFSPSSFFLFFFLSFFLSFFFFFPFFFFLMSIPSSFTFVNESKEVRKWFRELFIKSDLLERVWKEIYRLVEKLAKCKMGERGGKRVYWFVENSSKREVSECRR
jgi:hypothetical protein